MAQRSLMPYFFTRPLRNFPNLINLSQWSDLFDEDSGEESSQRGVRIYEDDTQLHVEVPLPGLTADDIEVSLNKGVLLVKGSSEEKEEDKKRKFYCSSKRNYFYSLALPTQIDEKSEPQATYTNGILNVTLQLAKQGETKKISVKAGKK